MFSNKFFVIAILLGVFGAAPCFAERIYCSNRTQIQWDSKTMKGTIILKDDRERDIGEFPIEVEKYVQPLGGGSQVSRDARPDITTYTIAIEDGESVIVASTYSHGSTATVYLDYEESGWEDFEEGKNFVATPMDCAFEQVDEL